MRFNAHFFVLGCRFFVQCKGGEQYERWKIVLLWLKGTAGVCGMDDDWVRCGGAWRDFFTHRFVQFNCRQVYTQHHVELIFTCRQNVVRIFN